MSGPIYLKPGQDFGPSHFSSDAGFTGSSHSGPVHKACGGAVTKLARGGAPKKAHHRRRTRPVAEPMPEPMGAPTPASKPLVIPPETAMRAIKKATQVGAIAGAQAERQKQAMGAGAMGGAPPAATPMMAPGAPPAAAPMGMKKGGHITAKQRHALPASDFALPGERYPVDTKARARNALSRVSQNGSSAEKAKVRAKVHSKYPEIGKGKR